MLTPSFTVEVIIANKPEAQDPEGQTIIRNLIHKGGFEDVKEVRAGKLLTLKVEAASGDEARKKVTAMCDELRLYNPAAHSLKVRVRSEGCE